MSGTLSFDYDTRGNTIQRGDEFFQWDINDRLVAYSAPGVNASYAYDSDGIQVSSTVNGVLSRKLVDHTLQFAQVLEERDAADQLISRYTYGNARLTQARSGEVSYFHHDGLGSTRALSASSGLVSDEYTYRAFGELYERVGSNENPYQFTGERLAPESGAYYLRSRWMVPGQGRFLSRDTYPFADNYIREANKYVYAANSPVLWADPSGYAVVVENTQIRNGLIRANVSVKNTGFEVACKIFTVAGSIYVLLDSDSEVIRLFNLVPRPFRKRCFPNVMRFQVQDYNSRNEESSAIAIGFPKLNGVHTIQAIASVSYALSRVDPKKVRVAAIPALLKTIKWIRQRPPRGVSDIRNVHTEKIKLPGFPKARIDVENNSGTNLLR